MNIRTRLMWLSVSMIAGLLLVGLGLGLAGKFIFFERRDSNQGVYYNVPDFFERMADRTRALAESEGPTPDPAALEARVEEFNTTFGGRDLALTLYDGERLLSQRAPDIDRRLLELAWSSPGSNLVVAGRTAVYAIELGGYRLVLVDTNYQEGGDALNKSARMYRFLIFSVLSLVVTVLVVSLIVSKFVFRRVMQAIDTLVDGANHLRDGDLEYRIDYPRRDEFSGVCQAFNQMAERLWESVNHQRRDEESRKQLIAGISHDLRTPLTAIKAYAEGLAGGVAATPEMRAKYLDTIKMKAEDMDKIIQQLFLFSKLDMPAFPLDLTRIDLGDELIRMADGIRDEYARAGMDLSLRLADGPAPVEADVLLLRAALGNILENSFKYKHKERGRVEVDCRRRGDQVVVTLTDDGPGVAEEERELLFEVFYRCDAARSDTGQGSGLGLAITAKIIRQMGGAIAAENVPGGGLAIVMTLPAAGGETP